MRLIAFTPPDVEQKVGLRMQVHPTRGETFLPANLRLIPISESRTVLQKVVATTQDNYIQMKPFKLKSSKPFSLQVAFQDKSFTKILLFK